MRSLSNEQFDNCPELYIISIKQIKQSFIATHPSLFALCSQPSRCLTMGIRFHVSMMCKRKDKCQSNVPSSDFPIQSYRIFIRKVWAKSLQMGYRSVSIVFHYLPSENPTQILISWQQKYSTRAQRSDMRIHTRQMSSAQMEKSVWALMKAAHYVVKSARVYNS